MRRLLLAVGSLLWIGVLTDPILAQDERSALEELRQEITAIERRVAALGSKARSATDELEAISEELSLREREVALAERATRQIGADLDANLRRLERLESEQNRQKEYLSGRMLSLYKLGRLSYLRLLLSGSADSSSIGMLRYMVGRDARVIEEFRATERQLASEREALGRRRAEAIQIAAILQQRREAVIASRQRQQRVLARIERERREEEARLAELRDKAERLERLLSLLTGDEEILDSSVSIREFRGALPWPVSGPLLERFGRQRSRRFATFTINNGIRIRAEPGAPVRAVFAGRVLYAQWFKGYGNLIIVDHGERVFTLYGNTRGSTLKQGDLVRNGEVIALVSEDEDGDSGALYFEVRVDNKPVDPTGWLR